MDSARESWDPDDAAPESGPDDSWDVEEADLDDCTDTREGADLRRCTACREWVYADAEKCPECGEWLTADTQTASVWRWLAVLLALVMILLIVLPLVL